MELLSSISLRNDWQSWKVQRRRWILVFLNKPDLVWKTGTHNNIVTAENVVDCFCLADILAFSSNFSIKEMIWSLPECARNAYMALQNLQI